MQIVIAGSGKLAAELLASLGAECGHTVVPWAGGSGHMGKGVVVHAGSGRELEAIATHCKATQSALVELSTGSAIESSPMGFPVVLCPNTNILMLKFMCMLEQSGHLFRGYPMRLTESHQASKTSVPGTAVNLADSLGISRDAILSVRDAQTQLDELHIPRAELDRHAFHQIRIQDGGCSLQLEARVQGEAPYARGVARIVDAVCTQPLENRAYSVLEFVRNGWV